MKSALTILIALTTALLFIPALGSVHLFDWDEINFAEGAREMINTGDYFRVRINYQPFWEKPPLFIWFQVLCMKMFGVNEFAARLPNALAGIATLIILYRIGRKYFSEKTGLLWALCYVGAFTPHLYFKSGIIDPLFNLNIFCGLYFLFRAYVIKTKKIRPYITAGIFLGLAVLTKGPAAVLITLLCIISVLVINKFRFWFSFVQVLVYTLFALLVTSLWFGVETYKNGFFTIREFVLYQIDLFLNPVASHGQPFYYHFLVLLIGCFPISIYALGLFTRFRHRNIAEKEFTVWMTVLFFVVLILFSIVKTKIVHYSSMCYIPLSFLAAHALNNISERKISWKKYQTFLLFIIGLIFSAGLIMLPLIGKNSELKAGVLEMIKDPFARANFMIPVQWGLASYIPGVVFTILFLVSLFLLLSKKLQRKVFATRLLLVAVALTLQVTMWFVVPKIEQHSQGAAIEFWEQYQGKDVYVQPLGYSSYAHYYYARVGQKNRHPEAFTKYLETKKDAFASGTNTSEITSNLFTQWLLEEPIDKPAYFCCISTKADEFASKFPLKKIGAKGGFVFFEKAPIR